LHGAHGKPQAAHKEKREEDMPDGTAGAVASILVREDRDATAFLTLNRPSARNGLSVALLDALHAALLNVAEDPAIRCVVIQSEGPVFCAGHDLKEITARFADPDGGRAFFTDAMARCAAMMQAIPALPQPVIAAVQGLATAAGCQLVAACDLVVASEEARFATPGVEIGLFCSTPAVPLSRAVPRKAAMEMLLLGEMVPAAEAHRIGLVNRVVPAGQALPAALDLARRIASRSAVALRLGKRGVNAQLGQPLDRAYEAASRVMVENMLAEDAAEGMGAFLAKRRPERRHR
jgi:enoyl-CoA hydratase/carnithine racemase